MRQDATPEDLIEVWMLFRDGRQSVERLPWAPGPPRGRHYRGIRAARYLTSSPGRFVVIGMWGRRPVCASGLMLLASGKVFANFEPFAQFPLEGGR